MPPLTPASRTPPPHRTQATTEQAGQRRACPGPFGGLLPLRPVPTKEKKERHAFEAIAEAIRLHDRPLVHIEEDENGTAVSLATRHPLQLPTVSRPERRLPRPIALALGLGLALGLSQG